MRRIGSVVVVVAISLGIASAAGARSTTLDIPVEEALKNGQAGNLLDVPYFMVGQTHPKAKTTKGEFKANRRTNAFNKSDRESCSVAFLSALIALQERARTEGGNAVIDVYSVTKNDTLKSATTFRCAAGNFVSNVVLMGTVAELPEKK
jgi:hypothetical protein